MSKLLQFLVQNPVNNITADVVISQRLREFPFKIKAMSGDEFSEYQRAATIIGRHQKASFNSKIFNEMTIINHTVEPNFRDADSIKAAGCTTPEQFLYKSLLAGEIAELAGHISTLSGFDTSLEDLTEEAKNS